jgi:Family of unknown function (DUF6278)
MGPKHGIARGVAVYGSPRIGAYAELGDELLGAHDLIGWARDQHSVNLTNDEAGLRLLDGHLDEWRLDSFIGPRLTNEAGNFLGSVIVAEVAGARWIAWPNGHPVVRLSSDRDVDVIALAGQQVTSHQAGLLDILERARRG